jgi:nicotinamide phosphoribosyltransferase
MIDEAEEIILAHGEPFNRKGWEYIVNQHGGRLPVKIRAAQEGLAIPTRNVLVDIINTDPECYWLTSFLETALLRAVWYPTTVATNSQEIRKVILNALSPESWILTKFEKTRLKHRVDFEYRIILLTYMYSTCKGI